MYTKNCYYKKTFFSSDSMIMVRFTKNELKLIAKNRGVKDFRNMSQEQLLENLDKLCHCMGSNLPSIVFF